MALIGAGNGGFALPMPAGLDFSKGHALWLYVRRTGAQTAGARLLTAFSPSRNTGFQLQFGGYTGATGGTGDLVLTVGSGATGTWGVSGSSGGRGRAMLGAVTNTAGQWTRLAANIEYASSAQRVARFWRNGAASTGTVSETAASTTPATGGSVNLFTRDSGTSTFSAGLLAELCWWQDYALTDGDVAALEAGADPQTIAPAKRFFAAHWASALAAEVGDGARTVIGVAPAIGADHPVLGGAGDTITLIEPADRRVFQRVAGGTAKAVTLAGGYGGPGAVAAIEYRIEDFGTGVAVPGHGTGTYGAGEGWATLSAAPAGGAYSLAREVPQGGWFRARVRTRSAGGATLAEFAGSNRWGVGAILLVAGQSNSANMVQTSVSPPAADPLTSMYYGTVNDTIVNRFNAAAATWRVPAGNGLITLLNLTRAALNVPVAAIPCGVDSSGLLGDYTSSGQPNAPGYWLDQTSAASPWSQAMSAAGAIGGDFEIVDWMQGEAEAKFRPEPATAKAASYKVGLTTLYARLRAQTGRTAAQLPFILTSLGSAPGYIPSPPATGSGDAHMSAIRRGQVEWAYENAGAFYGGSTLGLPLDASDVHWLAAGYATRGAMVAQTLRRAAGLDANGAEGPREIAATYDPVSGRLVLTYDSGGGQLAVAGGGATLSGFQVSVDDFASLVTIGAATVTGATAVELAVPTGLAAPPKVRFGYGLAPAVASQLVNNFDGVGTPTGYAARPTPGALTATMLAVALSPARGQHAVRDAGAAITVSPRLAPDRAKLTVSDSPPVVAPLNEAPLVTEVGSDRRLATVGR